jgi:hypothetical protein
VGAPEAEAEEYRELDSGRVLVTTSSGRDKAARAAR